VASGYHQVDLFRCIARDITRESGCLLININGLWISETGWSHEVLSKYELTRFPHSQWFMVLIPDFSVWGLRQYPYLILVVGMAFLGAANTWGMRLNLRRQPKTGTTHLYAANARRMERSIMRRCVWDGPRCQPRHLTYPQMSYPSFDSLRNDSLRRHYPPVWSC